VHSRKTSNALEVSVTSEQKYDFKSLPKLPLLTLESLRLSGTLHINTRMSCCSPYPGGQPVTQLSVTPAVVPACHNQPRANWSSSVHRLSIHPPNPFIHRFCANHVSTYWPQRFVSTFLLSRSILTARSCQCHRSVELSACPLR